MGKSARSSGGGGGGGGQMSNGGQSQTSNGGIMGSGIFGMFGSTVQCKAEDDSTYCSIIKAFNLLIIVFFVFGFLYLVYTIALPAFKGGKRTGGGSSSLFGGKK